MPKEQSDAAYRRCCRNVPQPATSKNPLILRQDDVKAFSVEIFFIFVASVCFDNIKFPVDQHVFYHFD